MKHDTYSHGVLPHINLAILGTDTPVIQYVAIFKRYRQRPESYPTATELYLLWSLAAAFTEQKPHAEVIKACTNLTLNISSLTNQHRYDYSSYIHTGYKFSLGKHPCHT